VVVVGVGGCADGLVVVGTGVVVVWVGDAVGDVELVPEECVFGEDEDVADWLEADVCDDDDPGEEKIAGTLDDDGPVHAETAAETTTIKVAQPRTVSRAFPAVPGMVMRAFMKPP
jgi:hypothetical protein